MPVCPSTFLQVQLNLIETFYSGFPNLEVNFPLCLFSFRYIKNKSALICCTSYVGTVRIKLVYIQFISSVQYHLHHSSCMQIRIDTGRKTVTVQRVLCVQQGLTEQQQVAGSTKYAFMGSTKCIHWLTTSISYLNIMEGQEGKTLACRVFGLWLTT